MRLWAGQTGKEASNKRAQQTSWPRAGKEKGSRAEYLGVEDIAGNSAEHEQPVFLHGPCDTQPGHPLQGALVSFIVVTQPFAFFFWELF